MAENSLLRPQSHCAVPQVEMKITRRHFVAKSALTFGSFAVSKTFGASPNDEIGVAIVGMGNRGNSNVEDIVRTKGARLVALCEVDSNRLKEAAESVKKEYGLKVKTYSDFRLVLESKDVDAVVICSPNHWHGLQTIWACQAGKDVYVEKPVCHNIWEGQQMLKAASKYDRIVQSGLQARSDVGLKEAFQWIQEGNLGKIKVIRSIVYDHRSSIGKLDTPLIPPRTCNYDLWLGPAEDQAIYRRRFHYDWHWDWNTGNGDCGNQGVHELDLVRWILGDPSHPDSVFSIGGRFGWNDAGNTPNMQNTVFDWSGQVPVIFELRDMTTAPDNDIASHYKGHRFGIVISGEGGEFRGGRGGGIVYDEANNKKEKFVGDGGFDHFPAFIRAVRSRKESDLACTLREGYLSTCLCHLANISMRTGNPASRREIVSAVSDNEWMRESTSRLLEHLEAWKIDFNREPWSLGRALHFDSKEETFGGDKRIDAVNKFIKRRYRKSYEVPGIV